MGDFDYLCHMQPPEKMTQTKPRDLSFDVMKGIAIYAVVMGHVLLFSPTTPVDTLLMSIITWSHMPLFFFISGYFSYKDNGEGVGFAAPRLWQRFKQLVVPMVVMSALYALYRSHSHLTAAEGVGNDWAENIRMLWCDDSKWGYWFTICLFEIIVIYRCVAPLMRRISSGVAQIMAIPAIFVALVALYKATPTELGNILELSMVAMYTPVFMAGALARRHSGRFNSMLRNQWVVTASLLIGGGLLTLLAYRSTIGFMSSPGATLVIAPIWHLLLVVVAFSLIRRWVDGAKGSPTASIKLWAYLGRNSLGIYLWQYFFLFPIPWLAVAIEATGVQFVPTFTMSFIASGLIVAVCCGVIAIVRTSRYMAFLTLGDPLRR